MGANRITSWQPMALSALRLVTGFTFSEHGAQKLLGLLGGHTAKILTLAWLAGVLEGVGGILLLVGLFSRPVALLLCGEMAVAYFKAHAPAGFWPIVNHGEMAVLYCFIFLYLFVAGPGPWSVDSLVRGKG